MKTFEMKISRDWDGRDLEKSFEITLHLDLDRNMIEFEITAPYYRNPVPPCPPGPTWKLWEYEVVEIFLVFDHHRYLEIEVGPHGHYLCLELDGIRKIKRSLISGQVNAQIHAQNQHYGIQAAFLATLPLGALRSLNAYAIFQEEGKRVYATYHPIALANEAPNFHLIDRFPLI